ncbi:MAG TPA: hypothetical protein VJL38_00560 [Patescibacteria group bacterium]|nr:hypothetical protein [Patescibacteria group bacterium]
MDALELGVLALSIGWAMSYGIKSAFHARTVSRTRYAIGVLASVISALMLMIGLLAVMDFWIHNEEEGFLAKPIRWFSSSVLLAIFCNGAWTLYSGFRHRGGRRKYEHG